MQLPHCINTAEKSSAAVLTQQGSHPPLYYCSREVIRRCNNTAAEF